MAEAATSAERALVAIFVPSLRGGGAERAMLMFGKELLARGYSVDLVVTQCAGPLVPLVPEGMRIVDLAQPRTIRALPKLVSYLRAKRPSALYATIMHANVIAAFAGWLSATGVPVIVRESNVPVSEPKRTLSRWLTFKLIPWSYRLARGVIAVSDGVAAELISVAPGIRSSVRVISSPVISDDVLELGNAALDHPWFMEGEPPVVLGVARLQRHKGFIPLVRAFADVRKRRPARLVILGEGPMRASIEAEARALGVEADVQLVGFVSNPFPYMRLARLFVLASEYEGLPNVLIQAMAFGTPVVATDCKSGPREILREGRLGRLVAVGDHDALVSAIAAGLDSPRQDESAQLIRRDFGAAAATAAYLDVAGLPAQTQ